MSNMSKIKIERREEERRGEALGGAGAVTALQARFYRAILKSDPLRDPLPKRVEP